MTLCQVKETDGYHYHLLQAQQSCYMLVRKVFDTELFRADILNIKGETKDTTTLALSSAKSIPSDT